MLAETQARQRDAARRQPKGASMTAKMVAALGLALTLAGCGQTATERTTGGAAAGAAAGAGVGALGGPVGVLAGGAIGAGAGAVAGATTSPEDVNLGRPPWTNPEARVPGVGEAPAPARRAAQVSESVREAQRALADRGFDPGPADGIWGQQSARAARDFQRANDLEETGRLDSRTMAALRNQGMAPRTDAPGTATGTTTGAAAGTGAGTGTTDATGTEPRPAGTSSP